MVRNAMMMVLGLGAVLVGPVVLDGRLAPAARADTPRQEWLEHHPVIEARRQEWLENHPGWRDWHWVWPGYRVPDPVIPVERPVRRWWRW